MGSFCISQLQIAVSGSSWDQERVALCRVIALMLALATGTLSDV